MGRVLGDTSACMVTAMAALGDRLGLFKSLATHGPSTADEVAAQSGTQPRYVREWLGGMAAAGYISYEPATEQFSLPAEHAAVLAEEGGPFFVGAAFQLTMPKLQQFDRVAEAFRSGGGVVESAYAEDLWAGQARFSAGWVEHLLTQAWVPSIDGPGRHAPARVRQSRTWAAVAVWRSSNWPRHTLSPISSATTRSNPRSCTPPRMRARRALRTACGSNIWMHHVACRRSTT